MEIRESEWKRPRGSSYRRWDIMYVVNQHLRARAFAEFTRFSGRFFLFIYLFIITMLSVMSVMLDYIVSSNGFAGEEKRYFLINRLKAKRICVT
jgi:hypothetical protein